MLMAIIAEGLQPASCGDARRAVKSGPCRYPLPPRIQALREIRALLKPYPARLAASLPQKVYEPPSKGRYRRRR